MSQTSIDLYNDALDAFQAGNTRQALAFVEDSLTEDPDDSQTWQLYTVILNVLGRTDDATRATAKLKEMGLSPADELLMKAAESASAGNMAAAIPHYEAALALDPQRAEIHTSHSLALMQCGDEERALAAAGKAVTLDPGSPHAQYALGHILRLTGKKEAALAALTRSVTIDPGLMIALYEQGMLLAENGELGKARSNFDKFLKAHPGDPSATQAIASIKERMGDKT